MKTVDIICQDKVCLKGHFLPAYAGQQAATQLPVLLSPATGVKQQFYLPFAQWLSGLGHDVLVFDYRGVGLSLQGPLKNNPATLTEWGQQDQVAALDCLLRLTGQEQVLLIGHSAGGQMIGLLPNHHHVARLVGVASSTGWLRGMRPAFRLKASLALRWFIPLGSRIMGYAPTAALGLGENLPAAVGRQWARWCTAGGYATNAVRGRPELDFHHDVRTPITVLHASDDDIATSDNVAGFLRTLPASRQQVRRIVPHEHGLDSIGHMNWFRRSHQRLWPLLAQALQEPA